MSQEELLSALVKVLDSDKMVKELLGFSESVNKLLKRAEREALTDVEARRITDALEVISIIYDPEFPLMLRPWLLGIRKTEGVKRPWTVLYEGAPEDITALKEKAKEWRSEYDVLKRRDLAEERLSEKE